MLRDVAGIVLAALLLLLPGAAGVDLFNPDEPREAEIAREMRASGDLVVPHFNGCPFLEKPPFFYWVVLAATGIPGLGVELAVRLPSVLAAIGLLIVVYVMGLEIYDRRTARTGALLLLTTFQFWWLGKRALLDMTLALFVGVAMLGVLMADGRRGSRGTWWLVLAGIGASGAVMTKGLIGLVIPGVAIAAYHLWQRRPRAIFSPPLLAAGVLPLAALGVWVALLAARPDGTCFVREFLVENHLKRFLGQGYGGHQQPPWYYLGTLATDYQPWSVFLPGALIALWPGLRPPRRQDPFLHAWILPALVVLSASSTKRSIYLLPLAAPMSLLVAAWWRRRHGPAKAGAGGRRPDENRGEGGFRGKGLDRLVPGLLLTVLGAILSAALPVVLAGLLSGRAPSGAREALAQVGSLPWTLLPGLALLAGIVAIAIVARRSVRKAGAAILVLMGLLFFLGGALLLPLAEPLISARRFGEVLQSERERGTRLGACGVTEGSLGQFLIYSGGTLDWIRPRARKPESACADCRILTSPELWLAAPGPRACLFTRQELERLGSLALPGRRDLFEGTIGGSDYVLVTSR